MCVAFSSSGKTFVSTYGKVSRKLSLCLFGNVSISHSVLRNDAVCKAIDCSFTYYSVVTSVDLLLFVDENS